MIFKKIGRTFKPGASILDALGSNAAINDHQPVFVAAGAEFSCALLPFLFASPRSPGSVKTHRLIPASPHNLIGSASDKFCPPPPTDQRVAQNLRYA
jgi:hypothetical protein